MIQKIPVSCSKDCSGGCPLLAHVEDSVLKRVTPNTNLGDETLLAQSGCVNGFQMPRTVYHPDRISKPLLRSGERGAGQFREVEWDEALDTIADRLAGLKARYGAQSILNLGGSGSVSGALHNTYLLPQRFFALFGGCTQVSSNYSSGACSFSMPYVLGERDRTGVDPATLQHTKLIILWGNNLMDTHHGSEMPARLLEASHNGTPIIVIDPRRSRTVSQLNAQWVACRPGTDVALMQAVLYVLLKEGLVDWDFVNRYSVGFDALARHLLGEEDGIARDPSWAEAICGTPAQTITQLAHRYGETRPAALLPGLSIQRTIGGEEAFRMSVALQAATGNLGKLGGTSGDLNNHLPSPRVGEIQVPPHPKQPSVPMLRWPDAVLEGIDGGYPAQIKSIYVTGSNYLIQGSDVHKNINAFRSVEFTVCHDYFLTQTARYCDVVLPVTTYLERNDIVIPDTGNYLLFSSQAVAPVGQVRNDYDIFCALAERLGFGAAFSEGKDEEGWLRSFVDDSEVPDYETFKQSGVYISPDQQRVGLSDYVTDPLAHPLSTPSGKIEIASKRYLEDTGFSAYPTYRGPMPDPEYPLLLITPKSKYRIHSQGSNIPWLREREEQVLTIHPNDAAQAGVMDGEMIEVGNKQGCVRITARVTQEITPGVVCLLEGVWMDLDAAGVDTAGSANILSSTQGTMPSISSATHGIAVQVRPA